jgi:hypothetical protein
MPVYRGVVRGNAVVLDEPSALAEGTVVEVRPVAAAGDERSEQEREEAFKQRLVEAGLLNAIRRPQPDPPGIDRTPIPILSGPPVSETIIEERR